MSWEVSWRRLQGEEPAAVDAVMKTEQKEVVDWAVQNDNKPLWTRSPREVRATVSLQQC